MWRNTLASSVYPRWRGEHWFRSNSRVISCGLSPLARGTPPQPVKTTPRRRFIPAGAGNTTGFTFNISQQAVYPRWRGEHCSASNQPRRAGGLSPLARGTLTADKSLFVCHRFIPAGAGNTEVFRSYIVNIAVYPRWRGEHTGYNRAQR